MTSAVAGKPVVDARPVELTSLIGEHIREHSSEEDGRITFRAPGDPVLVHADFHYGNMLFREARVVAVLDWEIAELGQPLLDLACLSVIARSGGGGGNVPGGGSVVVSDRDLLDLYGGADVEEFNWYLALTFYKYAGILGYNLMLHRRGKRPDPSYEDRTRTIVDFLDDGIRLLESSQARSGAG